MSKEVAKKKAGMPAVPEHLKNLPGFGADEPGDEWGSGQASGFPVISIKGKLFKVRRGDETTLITREDDEDEPATKIPVVILKTHPGTAKVYYEGKYVEGSDTKPTCYSNDGVHPAADAGNKQFKNCAQCPRNQWGSRITEDGKKAKECSDVKRLAVVLEKEPNDPMLLRVPATSLKTWDAYVNLLKRRGLKPLHLVTNISFDHEAAHQALVFKAKNYVTEGMVPHLTEALENDVIESIIGTEQYIPPTDAPAPEEEASTDEDGGDDLDLDLDDDDVGEKAAAEAAAAKKKAAAKKAAATRAKNKAKKEAEAKAAAEAAAEDDDDGDFDLDMDLDDGDDTPPKTNKAAAAGEEEAEDAEFEEDDDLDFDDLDFGD